MLDVFVELAIRWGDWYTVGAFAFPLAGLGLAWRLRSDVPEGAAALAIVSVALAAFAVPGYFQARDECRRLVDAARPRPGQVVIEGGTTRYTDAGVEARNSRYAAWARSCHALLR